MQKMWKTIVLCGSLFTGAALGLAAAARWIEPGALPATVAIGLCLVGVVLILAAPGPEMMESTEETAHSLSSMPARAQRISNASGSLKAMNVPAITPKPEALPVEKLL
jgi:hypothetical protein